MAYLLGFSTVSIFIISRTPLTIYGWFHLRLWKNKCTHSSVRVKHALVTRDLLLALRTRTKIKRYIFGITVCLFHVIPIVMFSCFLLLFCQENLQLLAFSWIQQTHLIIAVDIYCDSINLLEIIINWSRNIATNTRS